MTDCLPTPCPVNVCAKMRSSSSTSRPCSRTSSRASLSCSRPLLSVPAYQRGAMCCPGHPRPDCCLLPPPGPCLPRCPLGLYVERVKPIKPRRKCEPRYIPLDGISMYRMDYFKRCSKPRNPIRPLNNLGPSDDRMERVSTYRMAYPGCQPVEPIKRHKGPVRPCPKYVPMEKVSMYKSDYPGCQAPRLRSIKPRPTLANLEGKIEGPTTYKLDYVKYCANQYIPYKSAKIPFCPPSDARMQRASTYRYDYYPKCLNETKSFKPKLKLRFSDARMQGVSVYRQDYFPFHFVKCPPRHCIPARIYDKIPKPCMYACQGDPESEPEADDCNDPCPPKPGCCQQLPCGIPKGGPFPCDIGTAGKLTQACCDCLDDPRKNDDGEC